MRGARLAVGLTLVLAGCATPSAVSPARGQSPEQQASDRAACEAEAREEVARTDPRRRGAYVLIPLGPSPFDRAYAACLERRGYVVR